MSFFDAVRETEGKNLRSMRMNLRQQERRSIRKVNFLQSLMIESISIIYLYLTTVYYGHVTLQSSLDDFQIAAWLARRLPTTVKARIGEIA